MGPMASRLGEQTVPHTGPAWISFYTGHTERKHGVTFGGWLQGDVSFENHYPNTLFDDLVDSGLTVGSAFMPITYPATIATGNGSWMISGFPSTGDLSRSVAPETVGSMLPEDYDQLQARTLLGDSEEKAQPVDAWMEAERRKRDEILPEITDDYPVDALFYGTQICDVMGHRSQPIPPYVDAFLQRAVPKLNSALGVSLQTPRVGTLAWNTSVRKAYRTVDETLSILIDRYEPDHVLVVSDHGFQKDGRDHAYLGTSIASRGIPRPEYITEAKSAIKETLEVTAAEGTSDDEVESEHFDTGLSDDERSEIEERLHSLGYSEK